MRRNVGCPASLLNNHARIDVFRLGWNLQCSGKAKLAGSERLMGVASSAAATGGFYGRIASSGGQTGFGKMKGI
jgi:hypothetical protein